MMSYATEFLEGYIKPFNIKEFTHRDILLHTTTNCPHKVLQRLKKILSDNGLILTESKIDNKGTKKYTIEEYQDEKSR